MARGYGPDTSLLTISQKMYETRDPFIDVGKIVEKTMKPVVDEFTQRMKANEAAVKKALLELPQVNIPKVDMQLQGKLRNESIRQKRLYASAVKALHNVSSDDARFDMYTQQANDARNALVLINEDIDALKLLRENAANGLINYPAVSDWNSDISREAITNIVAAENNYLKDNIVFDGDGGWFVDPNRSDDDPKKRVRLSKIANNKFDQKEATTMYNEVNKSVVTNAKNLSRKGAQDLIGRDVHIVISSWGNDQLGKAAFDDKFFNEKTFIDVWLERNVDIANADAVTTEKNRLRNSDLSMVTGHDGATFRESYKKWLNEQFIGIHDIHAKTQSNVIAPPSTALDYAQEDFVKRVQARQPEVTDPKSGVVWTLGGDGNYESGGQTRTPQALKWLGGGRFAPHVETTSNVAKGDTKDLP